MTYLDVSRSVVWQGGKKYFQTKDTTWQPLGDTIWKVLIPNFSLKPVRNVIISSCFRAGFGEWNPCCGSHPASCLSSAHRGTAWGSAALVSTASFSRAKQSWLQRPAVLCSSWACLSTGGLVLWREAESLYCAFVWEGWDTESRRAGGIGCESFIWTQEIQTSKERRTNGNSLEMHWGRSVLL